MAYLDRLLAHTLLYTGFAALAAAALTPAGAARDVAASAAAGTPGGDLTAVLRVLLATDGPTANPASSASTPPTPSTPPAQPAIAVSRMIPAGCRQRAPGGMHRYVVVHFVQSDG